MRPSPLKLALSSMEKPSLFLLQKGREYYTNYTSSIKESPNPSCLCVDVSSGLVYNKAIEAVVHQCETCTWFQAQNAAAPLTPTPTPSHPWQICTSDIFTLEGADYLICGDFYSKMILIQCLPSGQSNATKVILLFKEMFSQHGIPEIFALAMVLNMLEPSLLSSAPLGLSPMKPQTLTIHSQMDLQGHV